MIAILQKDDPVLRKISQPVNKDILGTKKLTTILTQMKTALKEQEDGVAIAAPQVGVNWRMFVVSSRAFAMEKMEKQKEDLVFINPEIVFKSKDRKLVPEGCLSVRWLYGNTRRSSRVKVKAQDENGKSFTMIGTGLLAQIFQHEIDHLDGILFIDHAKNIEEIHPEGIHNNQAPINKQ